MERWLNQDERDALADNRTALWSHGHGIYETGELMMNEIKRYNFGRVGHWANWQMIEATNGAYVTFADHEADKQAALAEKNQQFADLNREYQQAAKMVADNVIAATKQIAALAAELAHWKEQAGKLEALLREIHDDCTIERHYRAASDLFGRLRDVLAPQPPAAKVLDEIKANVRARTYKLKRIEIILCEMCLKAKGRECHTPECALFLHAVDLPIHPEMYKVLEE